MKWNWKMGAERRGALSVVGMISCALPFARARGATLRVLSLARGCGVV
jgi:hypothetical protein